MRNRFLLQPLQFPYLLSCRQDPLIAFAWFEWWFEHLLAVFRCFAAFAEAHAPYLYEQRRALCSGWRYSQLTSFEILHTSHQFDFSIAPVLISIPLQLPLTPEAG